MKLKTLSQSIVAGALALVATAGVQAETVWDQRYEEYIDVDMKQTVICAAERHGSSELVWSNSYEEYVPRNFQRHVIKEDDMGPGGTRLVYKPEYEEYVPESLAGLPIGSQSGCIVS